MNQKKFDVMCAKLWNLKNVPKERLQYLLYKRADWSMLKSNARFKRKHKGERCFILGNGPSLNQEDLRCLENEYVFTVNQIARHHDFNKIKPTYHFWADRTFFELDMSKQSDRELIEVMKKVNTPDNKPECFFPIEQIEFIKKYRLDSHLKVNYFHSGIKFYNGYKAEIDYTKDTPWFGTVVQWCITMAIYMGFSEIYLLGCDNTGLMVGIKTALNKNDADDYGYELTENEKERLREKNKKYDLEGLTRTWLLVLTAYEGLFQYCRERDVKLINCSAQTVITSIPRMSLQNILDK